MDRRDFFRAPKKQPAESLFVPEKKKFRTESGINKYTGSFGEQEIIHLLKRTMFGSQKADINYFKTKTLDQTVDELLTPTAPDPPVPVKEYSFLTNTVTPDTNVALGTTWVNDFNNDGTVNSQRIASYKKWLTGVFINQDRSIREKLIMFLIDHFGNEAKNVANGIAIYNQQNLIRQYCLGNFKQLVTSITTNFAMLQYLNGYLNQAAAPDENYGRELQELFTVGKGPDSHYTESDVKMAAKVLTGWQINYTNVQSFFTPSRHDSTNKTFSSFYNNKVITGRTGATAGTLEIADLINMIFSQNEPAKFFIRKLYRWFVYYDIDSDAEANVISPLADIFRTNNYELKPVLSALFKSEHFFDVLNRGCYIKTPADLVIGSLREMNAVFPPQSDFVSSYGQWNIYYTWILNMGQNLHDPPNVSGMPPFYQEPDFHEIWINSDSLPKRVQFASNMVNTGYTVNNQKVIFDCIAFAKNTSNPSDPNILIDDVTNLLFRNTLSTSSKNQIKTQILLSGQTTDSYWTAAWASYIANPANTTNFNTINTRLKSLFQYLFNLSEFQLI